MLKFLTICGVAVLILIAGVIILIPFAHRAERRVGIVGGAEMLARAYRDYTNTGSLSNYAGNSYHVWLSSNSVTIGSTQYKCLLQLQSPYFGEDGTLGMTSNLTFIWLASKGPPKIIPPGYKPPLFGY
jgi:hypothetical protein